MVVGLLDGVGEVVADVDVDAMVVFESGFEFGVGLGIGPPMMDRSVMMLSELMVRGLCIVIRWARGWMRTLLSILILCVPRT